MQIMVTWRVGILCLLSASFLAGADRERLNGILQQLGETHTYSGVSMSPNGGWITWTEKAPNGAEAQTSLLKLGAPLTSARQVKNAPEDYSVVWSPDGKQVAFLGKADGPQTQVFVMSPEGGEPRQLTHLDGYIMELRWTPDGNSLSFLYAEKGGGGGPLEAAPAQLGEIGAEVHNQRLTTVDAAAGTIRQISPADLNVYEYDWSPDGQQAAAIAAPGPADNNWWIAKLYRVGAQSGRMTLLYSPPSEQQVAIPRWSLDGKKIAFVGGIMSDEGFVGGDLFVVDSQGGDAQNLTPNSKTSVSSLRWTGPEEMLVSQEIGGSGALAKISLADGHMRSVWTGTEQLHDAGNFPNLAFSADGSQSVAVFSDWQHAPEVWAGTTGNWKQVTSSNTGQRPHWGKAESITWTDGPFSVQGWLLYPETYDPAKKYPMVVSVHGGPASARGNAWPSTHFDMSVLASVGYFVFFPNPRGSYGQGEAFTRGNIKDFGNGDLHDILAGVDEVLKRVSVDQDRIGITGWSYGGFMTMWTVTQTHRFHAAVAGAGIANWQSYYGENGIDEWMIPYFGASVYDDPKAYAKSSPIEYIKQVKTPTLVLVGERDAECPAPQSFEFWHALKTLGVPSKLVVYPGEGHGFNQDKDQIDRMQRTAEWFDQYLSPERTH